MWRFSGHIEIARLLTGKLVQFKDRFDSELTWSPLSSEIAGLSIETRESSGLEAGGEGSSSIMVSTISLITSEEVGVDFG